MQSISNDVKAPFGSIMSGYTFWDIMTNVFFI